MSDKTKIVVFRVRELVYTGLFLFLIIVLIALVMIMFRPEDQAPPANDSNSAIQTEATASLGIRRSPLGDTATLPTLGPSGRQERLNC